jgi:hypothetical protein
MMNGFLWLLVSNLQEAQADPSRPLSFYMFDTSLTDLLRDSPTHVDFKPRHKGKKGKAPAQRWVLAVRPSFEMDAREVSVI